MAAETPNFTSHAANHFPISSGGGALAEYEKYLGPPTGTRIPTAFDGRKMTNMDLLDAYDGRNMFLADTVTGLALDNDPLKVRWETSLALPWVQSDEIHFSWTRTDMAQGLLPREPHEGVPRLLASSHTEENAHSTRRGLGFKMEADFMNTSKGRQSYLRNLQALAERTRSTAAQDTIYTLLTCKNTARVFQQRFGSSRISIIKFIEEEALNYGCAAMVNADRLAIQVETVRETMRKVGVEPDLIVFGPRMRIKITMVPDVQTQYYTAGPDGTIMKLRGPDALGTYHGLKVVQTRDYHASEGGIAVQLLTARNQIAEFNEMIRGDRGSEAAYHYTSDEHNIYIFDENQNDMVKILFRDAVRHSRLYRDNGDGWSKEVHDMIDDYNLTGRKPNHHTLDEHNRAANPVFFATFHNNMWKPIEFWGQMGHEHASDIRFKRIGESVAGKFRNGEAAYFDAVNLINEIENVPYNARFFEALIAANIERSTDASGTFVGEETPADLANAWNTASIPEWVPTGSGCLALPMGKEFADMAYPPGYASYCGFGELAKHAANPTSPWHEAGKRAAAALDFVQNYVNMMKKMFPSSEVLNAQNRLPWFHRGDACCTFFSNVLGVPRDPLFLLAPLKSKGTAREAPGATFNWSQLGDELRYNYELGTVFAKAIPSSELSVALSLPADDPNGVVWTAYDRIMTAISDSGLQADGISDTFRKFKFIANQWSLRDRRERPRYWAALVSLSKETNIVDAINKWYPGDFDNATVVREAREYRDFLVDSALDIETQFSADSQNKREQLGSGFAVRRTAGGRDEETNALYDALISAYAGANFTLEATGRPQVDVSSPLNPRTYAKIIGALKGLGGTDDIQEGVRVAWEAVPEEDVETSEAELVSGVNKGFSRDFSQGTYFRAPLTASKALLQSIAAGTRNPLVAPGNPDNGFITVADQSTNVLLRRHAYDEIMLVASSHAHRDLSSSTPAVRRAAADAEPGEAGAGTVEDPMRLTSNRGGVEGMFHVASRLGNKRSNARFGAPRASAVSGRLASRVGLDYATACASSRWNAANKIVDPLARMATHTFLAARADSLHSVLDMVDQDVSPPFEIVLFRMMIEHKMQSAIVMKGGIETGANVYGHANFELGANVMNKTFMAHYTTYIKAIVWESDNVNVISNIQPEEYCGGSNSMFVQDPSQLDHAARNRASIIAVPVPLDEPRLDRYVPWAGTLADAAPDLNTEIDGNQSFGYSTFEFAERVWGLQKTYTNAVPLSATNAITRADQVTLVAARGTSLYYNPRDQAYTNVVEGIGHRAGKCYPGASNVWNGADKSFIDFNWQSRRYE